MLRWRGRFPDAQEGADRSDRFWLRPKAFGYGATPITWEGWAVTPSSMIVAILAIFLVVFAETRQWPNRRPLQAACVAALLATLTATIVVSRKKTDGDWR
jgi:hypothetical protein